MDRRLLPVAIALLAALAGCAGSLQPVAPAQAQVAGDTDASGGPVVAVSAAGTASTAPDLAVVTLAVEGRARDADRACELVGYVAVHSLRVESGVNRAGDVVDAAVGAGATRVTGVRSISTSDAAFPYRGPVFAERGDGRSATSFESGDVTVRATVAVEYEAGADGA